MAFWRKKQRLLYILLIYYQIKELKQTETATDYTSALIELIQAISCILHLENWTGEKIIKLLIIEWMQILETEN